MAAFLNTFDNLRASFNEHYVTAILQLTFQVIIYSVVLKVGVPHDGIIAAGLVLQGPFILASVATLILLVAQRPRVLGGGIRQLHKFGIPALGVIMADGCLGLAFNWTVYWLDKSGNVEMAGWIGTFIRLFQSFLSPLLLVLFPVTTYVATRWVHLGVERKIALHRLLTMSGIAYGIIVGATIATLGPIYINHFFSLRVHGDLIDTFAISLFFGAAIAQKSCSMFQYAVSEARFISFGTVIVSLISVAVAGVSSFWLSSVRVVDVVFIVMGMGLPILLVINQSVAKRGLHAEAVSV